MKDLIYEIIWWICLISMIILPISTICVFVFGLLSLSNPFQVSGMIMCVSLLTYILSAVAAVYWY